MTEIEWSRLKASEIKALAQRNAIVIVPIGATEQHGPHLPSMVDWRCVHEVSHRAARIMEKTAPVVVAPTIPYGMSEHHMSLNGTITLDYATMYAVIRCVVTSAIRHGFKRIFVLNGHGGNTDGAAEHDRRADGRVQTAARHRHLLGHRRQVDRQAAGEAEGAAACLRGRDLDGHGDGAGAGESRRAVADARALHPGPRRHPGVNEGVYRWRQLSSRSPIGVIGDAGAASAEKGEKLLAAISADVAEALSQRTPVE